MKTLLVAEDNRLLRESLTLALHLEGYHVLLAHDVDTLFSTLAQNCVNALLCDVTLPPLGSESLVQRVRSEYAALPTLFMLSPHMPCTPQLTRALPQGTYLLKPFSVETLFATLLRRLT